ncbi:MAG: CDP-glycerol glycerophosphotransferase family protein [Deltaproteobacteria bacterium]|nr:CDP-glycerol glycerophosphotransferase family protein [Candidatus Zymogenaceae bacterium]
MFSAIHKYLPHVRIVARKGEAADYLERLSIDYTTAKLYPDLVIVMDYHYIRREFPIWGIRAVQVFHGIGCKDFIDRKDNRDYLCLVPGQNLKKRLEKQGVPAIRVVGYPKTDCFFDQTLDRESILHSLSLDLSKKTILYSPTWGSLSSTPIAADSIKKLSSDYNVIVKLHDLSEPKWLDLYRRIDTIRFVEESNVTSYMFVADLMISDFSSTIFEFAQLFRPIITILPDPYRARECAHDFSWWEITRMIREIDELKPAADKLLEGDWMPDTRYREVVNSIFSYNDGKSAMRAAAAIREYEKEGTIWKR